MTTLTRVDCPSCGRPITNKFEGYLELMTSPHDEELQCYQVVHHPLDTPNALRRMEGGLTDTCLWRLDELFTQIGKGGDIFYMNIPLTAIAEYDEESITFKVGFGSSSPNSKPSFHEVTYRLSHDGSLNEFGVTGKGYWEDTLESLDYLLNPIVIDCDSKKVRKVNNKYNGVLNNEDSGIEGSNEGGAWNG